MVSLVSKEDARILSNLQFYVTGPRNHLVLDTFGKRIRKYVSSRLRGLSQLPKDTRDGGRRIMRGSMEVCDKQGDLMGGMHRRPLVSYCNRISSLEIEMGCFDHCVQHLFNLCPHPINPTSMMMFRVRKFFDRYCIFFY